MLQSERNTDDGDAEQHPERQMRETNPDSSHKYPDDIHQHTEASAVTGTTAHFPPKRAKSQHGQLQRLETERNADDGHNQHQAGKEILHEEQKSAAKKQKERE